MWKIDSLTVRQEDYHHIEVQDFGERNCPKWQFLQIFEAFLGKTEL